MNGNFIGSYEVIRELGRGGMATVFLAHDHRTDRNVAIKVLPRQLMHDPMFRTRFEREARTIARLEHPAIVPIYEFGEHDEQPYLVMRHMSGGSLADRLRTGALSLRDTVFIVERISSALEEAHRQGVVHRDLKPGNILFDHLNNAYLADFGIVKIAHETQTLTGTATIGTPAYMSPEQVRGKETLDGRSDVYTLGVVLYEMLTGDQPYKADTPMGVAVAHLTEPPPDLHAARDDLPQGVADVIHRAMAKEREERFPTPAALARELARHSTGIQPIPQLPPAEPPPTVPDLGIEETIFDALPETIGPAPTGGPADPRTTTRNVPLPVRSLLYAGGALILLLALIWGIQALTNTTSPTETEQMITPSTCAPAQVVITAPDFPEEQINACWNRGHAITNLSFGNGVWAVAMSRQSGLRRQIWFTSVDFPDERIQEGWADRAITGLAYGNGVWAVVMSDTNTLRRQIWFTDETFPSNRIEEAWTDRVITDLAYGSGVWAVVMSESALVRRQIWFTSEDFPAERIRDEWTARAITDLAYGNGVWAIIMSGQSSFINQVWFQAETFPLAEIENNRPEREITDFAHGQGVWAVVMSSTPGR